MIAIIPARGGSKGLQNKNIKLLNNKPLIAYTIEAALKSKFIDTVYVSTDSHEIKNIAIQYGANVPFLRPSNLAKDNSSIIDVLLFTLQKLEKMDLVSEHFVLLQPTSPLRTYEDIDNAVSLYLEKNADSVISCSEGKPLEWVMRIDSTGKLEKYFAEKDNNNRQNFNSSFYPNGAIYIVNNDLFKEKHTLYHKKTYPYIMNKQSSIDIDDITDFKIAEILLKEEKL